MSENITKSRLVDTHTHITPNVDDGASSPEMALEGIMKVLKALL